MAIVEKEVMIDISSNMVNYYSIKGYKIPRREDSRGRLRVSKGSKILVKIDDLPKGSDVKVTKICDECGEHVPNQSYGVILRQRVKTDGKDRCIKCGNVFSGNNKKNNIKYNNSLENYAKENNKEYLLDEFSNKNEKKPKEISYGTNDKYWWNCPDCGSEYDMRVADRTLGGQSCPYCSVPAKRVNHTNCLWTTHPEVAKLLEDKQRGYEITHGSAKKEKFICDKCNNVTKKQICNVVNNNFSCPKCSDGISYPEKFMMSVLDQLNIRYEYQKTFKWTDKRYDFYIYPNIIIEVHGAQHYNLNNGNWDELEVIQENDEFKKMKAKENKIIHYITIDCKRSDMEWIKNKIIESKIASLYDLTSIDWLQCHNYASNTMIKLICKLWNDGIKNVTKLTSVINLSNRTIITYLKQGALLGWCDYDPKEEMTKSALNANQKRKKKVIQLTNEGKFIKEWESGSDASRILKINRKGISNVCNNKQKIAGGYIWRFKD